MKRTEIQKARLEEAEFQKAYEELFGDTFEKAVYKDTAENRKLGRVGKEYTRGRKKSNAAPEDKSRKTSDGGNKTGKIFDAKIKKEISSFVDDFMYDQGAKKEKLGKVGKKLLGQIETSAAKFYKQNPDLVGNNDFRMEMVGGDVDELKENYGDRKGFNQLNSLLEKWYDSDIFHDEDSNKPNASESASSDESKVSAATIKKEASTFIDDFLYDQGANKNKLTADQKKSLGEIKSIASDFYKQNPDLVGDKDFRMEMAGGDVDELEEKYGNRKGFKKFNDALEEWYG